MPSFISIRIHKFVGRQRQLARKILARVGDLVFAIIRNLQHRLLRAVERRIHINAGHAGVGFAGGFLDGQLEQLGRLTLRFSYGYIDNRAALADQRVDGDRDVLHRDVADMRHALGHGLTGVGQVDGRRDHGFRICGQRILGEDGHGTRDVHRLILLVQIDVHDHVTAEDLHGSQFVHAFAEIALDSLLGGHEGFLALVNAEGHIQLARGLPLGFQLRLGRCSRGFRQAFQQHGVVQHELETLLQDSMDILVGQHQLQAGHGRIAHAGHDDVLRLGDLAHQHGQNGLQGREIHRVNGQILEFLLLHGRVKLRLEGSEGLAQHGGFFLADGAHGDHRIQDAVDQGLDFIQAHDHRAAHHVGRQVDVLAAQGAAEGDDILPGKGQRHIDFIALGHKIDAKRFYQVSDGSVGHGVAGLDAGQLSQGDGLVHPAAGFNRIGKTGLHRAVRHNNLRRAVSAADQADGVLRHRNGWQSQQHEGKNQGKQLLHSGSSLAHQMCSNHIIPI